MKPWFTMDEIDISTHIISEYRHWEKTHCHLIEGTERTLLIDTGLGICDISEEVNKLTDKPVTAVAIHIHWDHIGGHKYYPDFYVHEAELN
jgi:glyoxylase-like metal-dependent hydrolase (beta-lactamase superfamily II)